MDTFLSILLHYDFRAYQASRLQFRAWPSTIQRTGLGRGPSLASSKCLTWRRTKVSNSQISIIHMYNFQASCLVPTLPCIAVRSISGHKAAICSLDFHRYGDILASGSMDTNLKVHIQS